MTKTEIRKTIDRELMYYLERLINSHRKYGSNDHYTEDYRGKCLGILIAADSLGLLDDEGWSNCVDMICWLGSDTPIDER